MDPRDSNQNSRHVINIDDTIIEQKKTLYFKKISEIKTWN